MISCAASSAYFAGGVPGKSGVVSTKRVNELLESGIKDRKPVIFGLTAVCLLLTVALMSYLTMDVSNLNFGFFTHEGVSVVGIIIVALPLVSAVVLAARFIKSRKGKKSDK